ncbi:hypothetical protein BC629DRAFT_1460179 [Irpex lacteus]|nr:hypothetical protein BC629DRAFT_1460179 [Irpex lacteus]
MRVYMTLEYLVIDVVNVAQRVKTIRNENGLVSQASGAPGSTLPSNGIPGSATRDINALATRRTSASSVSPTSLLRLRQSPEQSAAQALELENRFRQRLAAASEALFAQNKMHDAARKAGEGYGGGWYAVLPDGVEEYVWEKILWVQCATGEGNEAMGRYVFLERGKKESIMGNPAGVYMVYMGLRSALTEMDAVKRGEVSVSDERLARQLEAEYGIDPIPFGREVDKDPESPEGALLTKVLLDMTIGG